MPFEKKRTNKEQHTTHSPSGATDGGAAVGRRLLRTTPQRDHSLVDAHQTVRLLPSEACSKQCSLARQCSTGCTAVGLCIAQSRLFTSTWDWRLAIWRADVLNFTGSLSVTYGSCEASCRIKILLTRDYFDATASHLNTSAHSAPWRVSLYKDRQSNRRVGVFT